MEKEVAILLMSHGDFAKEARNSAELIVGSQRNIQTLGVHLEDELTELGNEMKELIRY
ncbi:PTS sugar transporter subunit IIA domain-containing protein [Carnobacterium maltaromaticum]|uniref:PTS sugar transporter subunit IIA domain-containing protein n=1 Tax=Carnobacterium maltaromaticum TaxID=2751 RepID=UPI001072AD67|nr:hypothetical protein [Carnobacterium maltaromaticum]TFJ76078.1 hypothetical protein CKN94_04380 [Carnobacterium maltaromaticum]TFJ79019.1 hypothetical protein CKN97_04375 [Carnobacterium maltaromaticum]